MATFSGWVAQRVHANMSSILREIVILPCAEATFNIWVIKVSHSAL